MQNLSRSIKESQREQTCVFAYGFDAAGFDLRDEPTELADGSKAEFLRFYDPRSLNEADGVVIPQGIFEKFETRNNTFLGMTTQVSEVSFDKWELLARERQVFDLLREGKWVCFLLGEIIDEIPRGIDSKPTDDTDLCKRLLNAFAVGRHHRFNLATPARIKTRDGEFECYVRDYGNPTTVLDLPHAQSVERRVLAVLTNNAVVGVEFDRQLFFLPFSAPNKTWPTAVSIVKSLALAISRYRQRRIIEIPSWVDEIRFRSEESLYLEINSLLEKVNRLESQEESLRDYKAILIASGVSLKSRIVAILESFFELKVDWMEEDHEQAIVKNDDGSALAVFDAKATDGDLAEMWIDQLNSQRTNRGLPASTPAVLVISNDTSSRWIGRRLQTLIPDDRSRYARDHNVLLVRAIDFLFLMQHLENDPQRKKRLTQLLSSGGGWLKADAESYRIV